jgi:hypothetical protein
LCGYFVEVFCRGDSRVARKKGAVGANSFARFHPKPFQKTKGETRKEKDQRERKSYVGAQLIAPDWRKRKTEKMRRNWFSIRLIRRALRIRAIRDCKFV